jgi:hypothetical protein
MNMNNIERIDLVNTKSILEEISKLADTINPVFKDVKHTIWSAVWNAEKQANRIDKDMRYEEYDKEFEIGDKYKVIEDFSFLISMGDDGFKSKHIPIGDILTIRKSESYDRLYGYGSGHLIFCDSNGRPMFDSYDKNIIHLIKLI